MIFAEANTVKSKVICIVAAILCGPYPSWVSAQNRTLPPTTVDGKGPAKSARLMSKASLKDESARPSDPFKGPDWIEMNQAIRSQGISNEIVLNSPNDKFSLKFTESPENEGDVAVYKVTLVWKGENKAPAPLGISAGAVISPDSRYVVLQPMKLVDVEAWKMYDLQKAWELKEGYWGVDRWSKNGKNFLVHVVQCPYDCPPGETIEYWLIELQ